MKKRNENFHMLLNKAICLVLMVIMYYSAWSQASVKGGRLIGNKLYYSAQTGEKNTLTGSLRIFKSDSEYEEGSAHLSSSGPIIISPTDFSMGTGRPMAETFTGAVTVDPATAPKPAQSLPATITGTYDIFYSCPMDKACKPPTADFVGAPWKCKVGFGPPTGHCSAGHGPPGGPHSMVEQKGKEGPVALTVYSLFDSIVGPGCVDPGVTITYWAIGYPEGGDFLWSNGKKGRKITLTIDKPQTISVTYTIKGVSYKASLDIKICCKCENIKVINLDSYIQGQPADPKDDYSNLSDSAEIRSKGCRQTRPVWHVERPAYISSQPDETTVFVRALIRCSVKVCATYPLEDGPCKKCVTVNFGAAILPDKPKSKPLPEEK